MPVLDSEEQQKQAHIGDLFKKAKSARVLGSALALPSTAADHVTGAEAHDAGPRGQRRPERRNYYHDALCSVGQASASLGTLHNEGSGEMGSLLNPPLT